MEVVVVEVVVVKWCGGGRCGEGGLVEVAAVKVVW